MAPRCGPPPKKPMGSFLIWMSSCGRKMIKAEHPHYKATEIASRGGEIWRQMSNEEKFLWKKKAAKARSNYMRRMKLHQFSNPNVKTSGTDKKRGTDRPMPKFSKKRTCVSEPAIAQSSTITKCIFCNKDGTSFTCTDPNCSCNF